MQQSWIKKLKAGDKVLIDGRYGQELHTIDYVSPAGRIVIGDIEFSSQGWGHSSKYSNRTSLKQATPEAIELIQLKQLREQVISFNLDNATDAQIKAIAEILKLE